MIPPPDVAMAIDNIANSLCGLVLNFCLALLILSKEHLRKKEFNLIILNRAILDLTYSCFLGILQPWAILSSNADSYSRVCIVAGFVEVALGTATQYAEPILACNRFISMLHSDLYKKVFKNNRNIVMICIGIWCLGIATTVPHLFTQSLGRVTGAFCCIRFDENSMLVTILCQYVPLLAAESLIAFFNYKIYRSIHSHQQKSMTNAQQSRLQKDSEMLYFIIVSALVPLTIQFPAVVTTWLHIFRPDMTPPWVMFAALAVFNLTPIANPIIAVIMVRPIRRHLVNFLSDKGIMKNNMVVTLTGASTASNATAVTTIKVKAAIEPGKVQPIIQ